MYGRAVSASAKSKHFYLAGGFRGLYPKWPPSNANRIILTESIIDAASLSQHVKEPVLALYGTNGFTKDHEHAIRELDLLEEVILFFDGDGAGKAAVKKLHRSIAADKARYQDKLCGDARGRRPE